MTLVSPAAYSTPYHILSVEGPPKTTKTALASRAPGKVVILSSEGGWDGVIQKEFPETWQDRFLVANHFMEIDLNPDSLFKEAGNDQEKERARAAADRQSARIFTETWNPFCQDYFAGLKNPDVKTTVWDLADQHYDVLRMVNFGKIERNPRLAYVPVNAEYRGLILKSIQARKNLVMIHQLGKKWVKNLEGKDVETDEWKRKGGESFNYLVHSFVRTHEQKPKRDAAGNITEPPRFFVEVLNARLNPKANGLVMELPPPGTGTATWVQLMMELAPTVDPEAWGE